MRLIPSTLACMFGMALAGASVAALLTTAEQMVPTAMHVALVFGGLAGGLSQYKGALGRCVSRAIHYMAWYNVQGYERPTGRILLGSLLGALGAGFSAALLVLLFYGHLSDLRWLTACAVRTPQGLVVGAACGVLLFALRKIILNKKTWSNWTFDDLYIVRRRKTDGATARRHPATRQNLAGVVQECPRCHRKQHIVNPWCACGEDLRRAQRRERTKYWFEETAPDGTRHRTFVGNTIDSAARWAAHLRKQRAAREGS